MTGTTLYDPPLLTREPSTEESVQRWAQIIWDKAREMGLDPFPTHYNIVPSHIMYEFGAYGLPGRYTHWTHGRDYWREKSSYDYGMSRIYEMVINTDPAQAFLLDNNPLIANKMVIAHVLGHVHVNKNNVYFAKTNRQMVEVASAHADRIAKYEYDIGEQEVEEFLDWVLAIQYQIDLSSLPREHIKPVEEKPKLRRTDYDDLLGIGQATPEAPRWRPSRKVPPEPVLDLVGFLEEHADLEDWQRDILGIVRSEMAYFAPMMRTKILHEGFASFAHTRIMRELELTDDEAVDWSRLHSGVLRPAGKGQPLNPYFLGYKLLERIEERWNNPSKEDREKFGMTGGQGRAKVFEVAQLENDLSLIRNYFDKKFCEDNDLFTYEFVPSPNGPDQGGEWKVVDKDWKKVRDTYVESLSSYGIPRIAVVDANYDRRRVLLLKHFHEGTPAHDLDPKYTARTLQSIQKIWGYPVRLETVHEGKPTVVTAINTGVVTTETQSNAVVDVSF